jgi:uncharacterized damage-inducible protein DinB
VTLGELRTLYEYNAWANARLLEVMEGLDEERLTRRIESSFPSLVATVAHIVSAEWIWLERWKGRSPAATPEWLDGATLGELRARLAEIERSRLEWLGRLREPDLESRVDYRTLAGHAFTDRLADLLLHVVNHASYHRGQLTTMLRQLGATPAGTDYIAFLRAARKGA